MSWDLANGFVPRTFDQILATMVTNINKQYNTNYDTTTIQGTNMYKYFYAGAQIIMETEQAVSDLSGQLNNYVANTNQKILQPRGTVDGFINFVKSDGVLNTEGSFEPITTEEQAGKIKFAILLDLNDPDYTTKKKTLIKYFHDYLSAGLYYFGDLGDAYHGAWDEHEIYKPGQLVTYQTVYYKAKVENTNVTPAGNADTWEVVTAPRNFIAGTYKAINGQQMEYAFYLPRYYSLTNLTITLPISANNNNYVMTQKEVQDLFAQRFQEYMVLGRNLEPESIASVYQFDFASRVVYSGSYTDDKGVEHTFNNTPVDIPFDVKFRMMEPANIVVVYE